MTFADKVLSFYQSLSIDQPLPEGVGVLHPYRDKHALAVCSKFYHKFYHDRHTRRLILGINPGRYGGGITGVPFTDPIKLEQRCGIANDLQKKPELSADFIYTMIDAFGGSATFYRQYYISAVSPLGFVKDGKNLNYYDIRTLEESLRDFILSCLTRQLAFGIDTSVCFCLGEGDNYKYIQRLNTSHKFFGSVVPLPHPRFIMQYKRKRIAEYVALYHEKLSAY